MSQLLCIPDWRSAKRTECITILYLPQAHCQGPKTCIFIEARHIFRFHYPARRTKISLKWWYSIKMTRKGKGERRKWMEKWRMEYHHFNKISHDDIQAILMSKNLCCKNTPSEDKRRFLRNRQFGHATSGQRIVSSSPVTIWTNFELSRHSWSCWLKPVQRLKFVSLVQGIYQSTTPVSTCALQSCILAWNPFKL